MAPITTLHFIYSGIYKEKYNFTTCLELEGKLVDTTPYRAAMIAGFHQSRRVREQHGTWSGLADGTCRSAGFDHQNEKWGGKKDKKGKHIVKRGSESANGVKVTDWNKFKVAAVEEKTTLLI